jgi:hypothetical protein
MACFWERIPGRARAATTSVPVAQQVRRPQDRPATSPLLRGPWPYRVLSPSRACFLLSSGWVLCSVRSSVLSVQCTAEYMGPSDLSGRYYLGT